MLLRFGVTDVRFRCSVAKQCFLEATLEPTEQHPFYPGDQWNETCRPTEEKGWENDVAHINMK